MSSSRGGIFSLNRLLGRKNKNEKSSENNLTKSSVQTNSTTNLEVIGPQNQIKPLAAVNNAPFEQTFRITVSLPHGQLYVARIGAKTKLSDLLDMISTSKLLDPNKFEFRHPTDGEQTYELSCTIGEVGLNEIKLVPKHLSSSIKEKTTVKYRSYNELRLAVRPHTMSSVSPYSSTNSLNSSDSSGFVSHSRSGIPPAPSRKKRAAPRPPSQNSIPEKDEKIVPKTQNGGTNNDDNVFKKPLLRQDFHVSSPNLTSNTVSLQSSTTSNGSSTNTSISSSFNRKYEETNFKKTLLNRPMSMQCNEINSIDDQKSLSISTNSNSSRNHSRTSSETSDITNNNGPEPAQRKKVPTPKKKAPTPPPRTISAITTGHSKTYLQNLSEEQIESDQMIKGSRRSSIDSLEVQTPASTPELLTPENKTEKMPNVTKVMLNVDKTGIDQNVEIIPNVKMQTFKGIMNGNQEKVQTAQNANISKTQITYQNTQANVNDIKVDTLSAPVGKTKKTSVVSLNMEQNEVFIVPSIKTNGDSTSQTDKIDSENVSEQINEIIEEAVDLHQVKMKQELSQQIDDIIHQAVEIKETKLNAVNKLKNKQNGYPHEINNNAEDEGVAIDYDSRVWNSNKTMLNGHITKNNGECSSGEITPVSAEDPIKPILNESRSFDFINEYSDHSLAASTVSTTNTTETPSTGPESIITSDIEDGYKGNDYENHQKIELNREEFIERQFDFLSEHLDTKTSLEFISDNDKNFKPIESHDVMSSTMIEYNNKTSPISDKVDVINELNQIINCKRLETFTKPCNDDRSDGSKRSSLSNFHIGAYTNGNHENIKTTTILANEQGSEDHVNDPIIEDIEAKITSVLPKQVNRSRSFHSTFANAIEQMPIEQNNGIHLSLAPRSTSFVSLVSIQKQENENEVIPTENELKKSPQKSSSELSIADSPLLQSLEVMKSILSTSLNFDRMLSAEKKPLSTKELEQNEEKPVPEKITKTDEIKPTIKAKAWKYEGPPAVNLSTWGERPKSEVFIKSDNDYIFGGVSKMAALQKRFSGIHENIETKKTCEKDLCKLPVVRGVEYKKNININSNGNYKPKSTVDSSIDLVDEVTIRPNYEISRIVPEKPFSVEKSSSSYKVMIQNQPKSSSPPVTHASNCINQPLSNPKPIPPKPIGKYNSLHRPHSLILQTNGTSNGGHNDSHKLIAAEKPMFSQFTLRKTGLKEKFLDDKNSKIPLNENEEVKVAVKPILKSNPIPTAPKPPPMLKPKTLKKSVSMGPPAADQHDLLFDSIRNFNRNTLKRNCLV